VEKINIPHGQTYLSGAGDMLIFGAFALVFEAF